MIPHAVPNLSGNESIYLQECVATNFVSSVGPFVDRFERLAAEAAGATGAVATASGTAGLHAALVALGVGGGDLVIVPSLTFIASANAVVMAGAEPWLFDVTEESWTLDPQLLDARLAAETRMAAGRCVHHGTGRRVAAIMPVHTLGLPADMDRIAAIAGDYGLPVLADAAAALGATYRGRSLGRAGARLSVYSFNGNKTVTAGGGGAVVGDDASLVALVRHLTTTARAAADYTHDRVGFNYRMTNLQAAVGCAQLERIAALVAAKRAIARRYDCAFAGLRGVGRFPAPEWAESACWFSGVTLDPACAPPRADVICRLRAAGVDARPFWKPVHLQPPYRAAPRTAMTVTERLWQRIVTLPCSTALSAHDQDAVIAAVRAAVEGR